MAVGLPVLASDAIPMVRILKETGAGTIFGSGSSEAFARELTTMLDDVGARQKMGERGHRAVQDTYNWAVDAQRLLRILECP
jgi:glycosyltransferase involved in cell wall biosynthesis